MTFDAVVRRIDARGCEVVPEAGGEPLFASVRGKVHRIGRAERSPLAPGDRVSVETVDGGSSVLKVHPRKSRFSRESADGRRPQVVAANVDLVLALLPAAEPDPSPRLVDRILVAASWQSVECAVVVSKTDLATEEVVRDMLALYADAGIRALTVSVPGEKGLDAVVEMLRGRTSVLVGPSGAGKSTLLRRLLGTVGENIVTGIVNAKTGKGRHTTTASQLLPFPGGGWVVDTPGVRTLALTGMLPTDVGLHFPDIARLEKWRFQDCRHSVEPGCAVLAAVEKGTMDRRRHESYRAICEVLIGDEKRKRW
jgi:ribosome biogenesis GTPase